MKKTTTPKLSLRKESLRVLSDKAMERANGGVYTSTNDVCSTESQSKCGLATNTDPRMCYIER